MAELSFESVDHDPWGAEASPARQYVLDTIAEGEAPDYKTLYGGHKFSSTKSHPGIAIPIGDTGQTSTAAGRYQLLKSTWDTASQKLGLKDFSPESQDAAAWWLADRTYQQKTGRSLASDAAKQDVNWGALTNQWPSLKRLVPAGTGPTATVPVPEAPGPEILSQLPAGGTWAYKPLGSNALVPAPVSAGAIPFSHTLVPIDHDPFGDSNG